MLKNKKKAIRVTNKNIRFAECYYHIREVRLRKEGTTGESNNMTKNNDAISTCSSSITAANLVKSA